MEPLQERLNNPPPTHRAETQEEKKTRVQRRAREVSSRYMMMLASPVSSSSSSDLRLAFSNCPCPHPPPPKKHPQQSLSAAAATAGAREMIHTRRSPSVQRRHSPIPSSPDAKGSEAEGPCFADENRPMSVLVSRSLETLLPSGFQGKVAAAQRRRPMRLFRENCGEQKQQQPPEHPQHADGLRSRGVESKFLVRKPRPGTPMVYSLDRTTTTTTAASPRSTLGGHNLGRFMVCRTVASRRAATQVNRSLQETLAGTDEPRRGLATPSSPSDYKDNNGSFGASPENSTVPDFSEAEMCSISSQGVLCDSPPIHTQGSRVRLSSDCRSSMPKADLLPTTSVRLLMDGSSTRLGAIDDSSYKCASSSLCSRSLNSALSSCQHHEFNLTKSFCKSSALLKAHPSSAKAATVYLPPQPQNTKLGLEPKKGKKMSGWQEDVYALRLLENRYLQWRFVNAKAQAAVQSQRVVAGTSLSGLSAKISELNGSVMTKSIELGHLKKLRSFFTVLEAQMPYLDEWTTLEADYSCSLSGAIKSLQDASLRLPIMGNVKADVTELSEILDSTTSVLEALAPHVGAFLTKAEGMDSVISDLARTVNREWALIEECGDLLSEVHRLQVKECSLRSQLIQLKRTNSVEIRMES